MELSGLPDLHGRISTCRCEARSIGRPCYTKHHIGMPSIGEQHLASGCFPHLDGCITASCGNQLAISRPLHVSHRSAVTCVGEQGLACRHLPEAIRVPSGDQATPITEPVCPT